MAVFTQLSAEDIEAALARYDAGSLIAFEGITAGIENTNYKVRSSKGDWVLSLFEGRTPREALPFIFDLIAHLHGKGLPVAQPLKNLDGNFVSEIAGKAAALVGFLPGACDMSPGADKCTAVGKALTQIHLAGSDFKQQRGNPLGIPAFAAYHKTCPGNPDDILPGLSQLISDEIEHLIRNLPEDLPAGVVHADLFPDNVLFLGARITGLIDFYYACTDWWAYDLAITLTCWACEENGGMNQDKAKAMLQAYEDKRPLTPAERAAMPYLLRAAALRFLLTRTHDWLIDDPGAVVTKKDPLEYVRILRYHQNEQNGIFHE